MGPESSKPEKIFALNAHDGNRPHTFVRRLWPMERTLISGHLLRLDAEDRRRRFGRAVDDHHIRDYASRINLFTSIGFGLFAGTNLRGVGLLEPIEWQWPMSASAWLSVEKAYQRQGVGAEILTRLLTSAQNRYISPVYVLCLNDNAAMKELAERFDGATDVFREETESRFVLEQPTPASYSMEAYAETDAWMQAWNHAMPRWFQTQA